ncbi:Suf-domain-containing protein [Mycena crocata]|nr:Suf-domain-containing protein [Mycena crocata]
MSRQLPSESGSRPVDPVPSRYDGWTTFLRESPGFWIQTVAMVEKSGDVTRIRETYDGLLRQYPDNVSVQLAYIRHSLGNSASFGDADVLFRTFLSTSLSVDLWKSYLRFIRRFDQASCSREAVRTAYDHALDRVGHSHDSGDIWIDYIGFLDDANVAADGERENNLDAIRKVYHRAVAIPLDNVRELWSRLEAFEARYSRDGHNILAALSPAYTQACTALAKLSVHLRGLDDVCQQFDGQLFLPAMPTYPQDRLFVGRWKSYLKWEEGDPLGIGCSDNQSLFSRVWLAYHKALVRMRFYPEIWYMAFRWVTSAGKRAEALALLAAGLEANPDSFLLTYAYAEYVEMFECAKGTRDFNNVHRVYERLLEALRAQFVPSIVVNPGASVTLNHAGLAQRKRSYNNAWINYLRFIYRAEGLQPYRLGFDKARRDEFAGCEVFESAAMTEYYCNTEDGRGTAARIFQEGLKKFASNATYVFSYLNFLLSINDDNNARALFETVITTFTPSEAKPIWTRWYQFRCRYDALDAILDLESRMAKVYPDDGFMKSFGVRHASHSFDAIAEQDLGWSKIPKPSSTMSKAALPSGSASPSAGNGRPPSSVSNDSKRLPLPREDLRQDIHKRRRLDDNPTQREREFAEFADSRGLHGPQFGKADGLKLPPVIENFMRQLPPASSFDGPVFTAHSLMERLKATVVPSTKMRMLSAPLPFVNSGAQLSEWATGDGDIS